MSSADEELRITPGPVRLAPREQGALRFSLRGVCLSPGAAVIYDGIDLKVRVGGFTRTEHVDFADNSFVLVGTKASQDACPIR